MLPLEPAIFVSRYKRFLSDVTRQDGATITVHCPNTGSMRNCMAPGTRCFISQSTNLARKYPFTLEVITTPDGDLACINTARANGLVARAIDEGVISQLQGYRQRLAEQKYGQEQSRIDWLLRDHPDDARACYVEVKNLTLKEAGLGQFPDAVSERGTKHLRELIHMAEAGARAVLVFCVAHSGVDAVAPADHIDPVYGATLRAAIAAGVEVLAYQIAFTIEGEVLGGEVLEDMRLVRELPIRL